MTKVRSHVRGVATVITFEDTTDKALIVDIDIDCPACGQQTVRLIGHHLRAVQRLLAEYIEEFPDLTGNEAGIEVLQRMGFTGTPPVNPEDN